ncbi:MAG: CBS domain-containing protein [Cyanobacteria bacterium P01_F01_bin.3]
MAEQNDLSAIAASDSGFSPESIAKSCMSSPVRTVAPTTLISDAQKYLLRYGHTALCVVDASNALVGMLSRRDVEVAIRHGLGHVPVHICMGVPVKTAEPETPLAEIQSLMLTYDIGRIPIILDGSLVGIVTRSDVLRQLSGVRGESHSLSNIVSSDRRAVPAVDVLYAQLKARIKTVWPALMLIADAANEKGWTVYLVGGAVRDLLLNCLGQSHALTDIDLVVDGAQAGAGSALAEIIESSYPQVTAQVYGEFQSATLRWVTDDATFSIDIVTARTEFYAYPAANPEVDVATIHQDLYRRDFTVNAMALRLVPESTIESGDKAVSQMGRLLDFFGGWIDLERGHIRVIHPNSFIEDPTRIFRAVRFAVRLGFVIEERSEQLIRYAVSSGIYAQLQAGDCKIPALQSRLTTELESVLSSEQWSIMLAELDRLGALACIHRDVVISTVLWRQLRRMARWQPKFAPEQPRWLLLLSLLIVQLPPNECIRVATTLNLSSHSQQRFKHFHSIESDLLAQLPLAQRPSQVFNCLKSHGQFELLLIAARHPYTLGPHIWHYIAQLSRMSPLINGATLKRLGYQPSSQFREILAAVHQQTLDGELHTAQSAEDYVTKTYPRSEDLGQ